MEKKWVRAVWREDGKGLELAIPSVWVEGDKVNASLTTDLYQHDFTDEDDRKFIPCLCFFLVLTFFANYISL